MDDPIASLCTLTDDARDCNKNSTEPDAKRAAEISVLAGGTADQDDTEFTLAADPRGHHLLHRLSWVVGTDVRERSLSAR